MNTVITVERLPFGQNTAMVETGYLASTLLMGLLGLGVLVLVLRARGWYEYTPQVAYGDLRAGREEPGSALSRYARSTNAWTVAYLLLVLGFTAAVLVYLSGAITGLAVVYAVGGIVALYLVVGVYVVVRDSGRPNAQAVAATVFTVALLVLAVISARLIMS